MDDAERSAIIGTVIGFLLGVIICMGGQIVYMEVQDDPATQPEKKIVWIEKWDGDDCIVLVNNGEEIAPVEPPFDCDEAQEEYPQAEYREV